MIQKIRDLFRKTSWPGFMSVLCALVAAVVFVFFALFEATVVLILFAIYFVLVSFRDE